MRPKRLIRSPRRRRRGFTLVELLVVIAIISVLISLLFPALRNARDRARMVQCANRCRNIGVLVPMYAFDHGRPPYATPDDIIYWGAGSFFARVYAYATGQAFENNTDYTYRYGTIAATIRTSRMFTCPQEKPNIDGTGIVPNELLNEEKNRQGKSGFRFRQLDAKYNASAIVVAGDGNGYGIRYESYTGPYSKPMFRHTSSYACPDEARESSGVSQRGDGRAHLVFADGHVEPVTEDVYDTRRKARTIILDFR